MMFSKKSIKLYSKRNFQNISQKIIAFTLLAFSFATPLLAQSNSASYYRKVADSAVQQNDLSLAIEQYSKALELNAHYIPALTGIASALLEIGDVNRALEKIESAYKLSPKTAKVLLVKARILLETKNFSEAKKIAQEGLTLTPQNSEFEFILAKVYLYQGNISLAQDKTKRLITSSPNFASAYILMGEILTEQKRFDSALQYFQKARLIEPDNSEIFVQMSITEVKKILYEKQDALQSQKDLRSFETAISHLQNAQAHNRNHVSANFILGQIYALSGDCSRANTLLQKVIHINPTHRGALTFLSFCRSEDSSTLLRKILYHNQNDDLLRFAYEKSVIKDFSRREHPANMENIRYHLNNSKILLSRNYLESAYELLWAEFLNPDYAFTHEKLLSHYRNTRDYENYIKQLNFLRKREASLNSKTNYQDLFELYTRERSQHLYYQAGIKKPSLYKTEVPVFVFFPKPKEPFSSHPFAAEAIAENISFALENIGRVKVPNFSQRQKMYHQLSSSQSSALQAIYYNPTNAKNAGKIFSSFMEETAYADYNSKIKTPPALSLSYVVDGSFQEIKDGVSVSIRLINLSNGRVVSTYRVRSQGRGYLRKVSMAIAKHIYRKVQPKGYVIKINSNHVVLNVGERDGIRNKQTYAVYRGERFITKVKIAGVDKDMAVATPTSQADIFLIQAGDEVKQVKE